MSAAASVEEWHSVFPALRLLEPQHAAMAAEAVKFVVLEAGAVAYQQDFECPNYLMCLDGRTRVFKLSESGRQILIYTVSGGGTCLLTTQCLLSGGRFPAESVAEKRTVLAAIPASVFRRLMADSPAFRTLVLDDYSALLGTLFSLVDEVAFAPLEQRLARRLLADADTGGMVRRTHQELAGDVASVREMVSRHLGDWERAGWITVRRGAIEILDRVALASHGTARAKA